MLTCGCRSMPFLGFKHDIELPLLYMQFKRAAFSIFRSLEAAVGWSRIWSWNS